MIEMGDPQTGFVQIVLVQVAVQIADHVDIVLEAAAV